MIKALPDVVRKHLKCIYQGTNLGKQYRSRTSISQFVCARIFIRFSQCHGRADAQQLKMNEWLVSSFAQSPSALEDLVSVMSDLDAFACLPNVIDSVNSEDVGHVLREDLTHRINRIEQNTLEQVLERVAFGDDVVSKTFFRAFENTSSWILKVWSLVSDNVEGARSEIVYLLVMSIVRSVRSLEFTPLYPSPCVVAKTVRFILTTSHSLRAQ